MPFRLIRQLDAMQCGVASLAMVCGHHGLRCSVKWLEDYCTPTTEGVSLKGIADAARDVGLDTVSARVTVDQLAEAPLPAILHWNQNHFVVLYKIGKLSRKYHIADPGKGKMRLSRGELEKHWLSTTSGGERKGIAMFLEPTEKFGRLREEHTGKRRSLSFLNRYLREFRPQFVKIFLALLVGSLLQLVLPFLTQAIVDTGISRRDIGLIWLILLGELAIVAGRTATDFFRRWILLRVSMRINISLVSDFFIKLLRLPMSFFDTKLMGDLLQRIGDHSRVQSFLTTQALGIMFTALSFIVFGIVLLVYDPTVFLVFLAGSAAYGLWIAAFLRRRKVIDYELFERQALNQNRTYQFVTSMQEIKLQDCEAAVYRNPDFILLDEATNALDARNERAIVENLAEFYRGRTVVVVAHRLSTVRDADRIIVLDRGHVAETGTHASLIALRGVYHTLVKNQLELGN